jgi:radical SAM-linked protein
MSEVRQRWRLAFGREDAARFLSHLDAIHLWERAFRRGEIPVATSGGFSPRPRLIFAAPLPLGTLAEHELADLYLAERLTRADLRERLAAGMPLGYRLIDLHDEWIGGPALATQLAAADYRMTLLGVSPDRLAAAVDAILAAAKLPREKRREKRVTAYDLRPLILGLKAGTPDEAASEPVEGGGAAAGLWMRLVHTQDQGSGRAEEVVAALADELGLTALEPIAPDEAAAPVAESDVAAAPAAPEPAPEPAPASAESPAADRPALEMVRPVRERLWLAEELGA